MNILLVIEGLESKNTTFSLLSLNENSLFLQFSPEFHLHGLSVGELYSEEGIEGIKRHLIKGNQEWIDGYVILTLKNLIALLHHFYPRGIQYDSCNLSDDELFQSLTYSDNLDEQLSIFSNQQYFFKLLFKKIYQKRSLIRFSSIVKTVCRHVETDIERNQWLKILMKNKNDSFRNLNKMAFPVAQTFRVIQDQDGKHVKIIDIGKNERLLRRLIES